MFSTWFYIFYHSRLKHTENMYVEEKIFCMELLYIHSIYFSLFIYSFILIIIQNIPKHASTYLLQTNSTGNGEMKCCGLGNVHLEDTRIIYECSISTGRTLESSMSAPCPIGRQSLQPKTDLCPIWTSSKHPSTYLMKTLSTICSFGGHSNHLWVLRIHR